jgi:type VI protein secretion system component Hcp
MKNNNKLSTLFAALFFVVILSMTAIAVDEDTQETIQAVAISADFEYCPDGTMVESLDDCPDFKDDTSKYVEGDEYGFVTNIDEESKATIITNEGAYFADVKITHKILDKSSPLLAKIANNNSGSDLVCGFSNAGEVVCKLNSYDGITEKSDDGNVYCWGNNELRECPGEEIETSRGGGAGKVSIQDIKIESKAASGSDGPESSTEPIYQMYSTQVSNPDDDNFELSYVWFVNQELQNSNGEPEESMSLSFSKIEIKYSVEDGSGASKVLDLSHSVEIPTNSLIFTNIIFDDLAVSKDNERCRVSSIIGGGDCDDSSASIPPSIKGIAVDDPTTKIRDNVSDYLDPDDDGDGVLTSHESSRGPIHRDVALNRAFIADTTESLGDEVGVVKIARPNEWSDEDRLEIKAYIDSLENISGKDFGLAIALAASENPKVREVRYNNETNTVEIDHDEEVRLLGFIRMNARAKTTIDAQGNEETKLPWWAALATKSENKVRFKAGADLSKSVN